MIHIRFDVLLCLCFSIRSGWRPIDLRQRENLWQIKCVFTESNIFEGIIASRPFAVD